MTDKSQYNVLSAQFLAITAHCDSFDVHDSLVAESVHNFLVRDVKQAILGHDTTDTVERSVRSYCY